MLNKEAFQQYKENVKSDRDTAHRFALADITKVIKELTYLKESLESNPEQADPRRFDSSLRDLGQVIRFVERQKTLTGLMKDLEFFEKDS